MLMSKLHELCDLDINKGQEFGRKCVFKCGLSTEFTTSRLVLTAIAVFIFPGLFAGWDRC